MDSILDQDVETPYASHLAIPEEQAGTLPSGCVAYTVQALGRVTGYVWGLVSPESSQSLQSTMFKQSTEPVL